MIEGYTFKQWRQVSPRERAAWYVEAVGVEARRLILDPANSKIADELIDLTKSLYLGLIPEQNRKEVALRRALLTREMSDNPNWDVRLLADFNQMATVVYFLPEVKPI